MSERVSIHEERLLAFFDVLSEELQPLVDRDSPQSRAAQRLMSRMRKRAALRRPHLAKEAIEGFLANNRLVGSTKIAAPEDILRDARHYITVMLERYATCLDASNIQVVLDRGHLLDLWRFGPGASNGVKGTHAAEKISQPMTTTVLAEPLVLQLRRNNAYFCLEDFRNKNNGIRRISGSKLTTVPKNEETERTIAIEPSGNMCLQLAAGAYLEGVLRYIGLDIRDQQPKNKVMALRGSVDGSIATIDLKSASDMLNPDLVRKLFPTVWVELLFTLRSETTTLPDGSEVRLEMVSTMGNGFTFPLMTLILSSLIYGLRCSNGGPNLFIDWSNTCVFGDDIIVPTGEFLPLCELLTACGYVVNFDKSFGSGPFRESCGGDYYEGYDITPFYVKSLSTDAAIYTAVNQVFEWCARHKILLHRTIGYLRSCINGKVLFVPEWRNPDQGFLTASCPRQYKYLSVVASKVILKRDSFYMPLAAGGYITEFKPRFDGSSSSMFFSPRQFKNVVKTRRSRLPNGFLDGSCPLTRTRATTDYIQSYAFLLAE